MAEEDESSYGAYFLHLDATGELNPFPILGVTPVMGLTEGDITDISNSPVLPKNFSAN